MIYQKEEFTFKEGDILMIEDEKCVLCPEQPIHEHGGRLFKTWAAESECGGFYAVVEMLNKRMH